MANEDWGQVRPTRKHSWHRVATFTRGIGMAISVCGRSLRRPYVKDLPWDGKSCESCLRILERRKD